MKEVWEDMRAAGLVSDVSYAHLPAYLTRKFDDIIQELTDPYTAGSEVEVRTFEEVIYQAGTLWGCDSDEIEVVWVQDFEGDFQAWVVENAIDPDTLRVRTRGEWCKTRLDAVKSLLEEFTVNVREFVMNQLGKKAQSIEELKTLLSAERAARLEKTLNTMERQGLVYKQEVGDVWSLC